MDKLKASRTRFFRDLRTYRVHTLCAVFRVSCGPVLAGRHAAENLADQRHVIQVSVSPLPTCHSWLKHGGVPALVYLRIRRQVAQLDEFQFSLVIPQPDGEPFRSSHWKISPSAYRSATPCAISDQAI